MQRYFTSNEYKAKCKGIFLQKSLLECQNGEALIRQSDH